MDCEGELEKAKTDIAEMGVWLEAMEEQLMDSTNKADEAGRRGEGYCATRTDSRDGCNQFTHQEQNCRYGVT